MNDELVGINYSNMTKSSLPPESIREKDRLRIVHNEFTRTGMTPYADALEIERVAQNLVLSVLCEINYEFRNPKETLRVILTLPDGAECTGLVNEHTASESEFQFADAPSSWPRGTYRLKVIPTEAYRLQEIFLLLLDLDHREEELVIRAAEYMEFTLTTKHHCAYIAIHFIT